MWGLAEDVAFVKSYSRRRNVRHARIARDENESLPTTEASSCLLIRLVAKMLRTMARMSAFLSAGKRISRFTVSNSIPRNVRDVEGPSTFSGPTGTSRYLNMSGIRS